MHGVVMKEKKTVLICEDDVSLNKQISQSIKHGCLNGENNVEVLSAYTLNQSLDFINSRYFSLILIDLNLGGQLPKSWKDSEGIIIIERLKEKKFGTKIFVSSANPETDLVFDLVKKYSIDNYIAKGANVPIIMMAFDFANKKFIVSEPFYTTDDMKADFDYFLNFYKNVVGDKPELFNNKSII